MWFSPTLKNRFFWIFWPKKHFFLTCISQNVEFSAEYRPNNIDHGCNGIETLSKKFPLDSVFFNFKQKNRKIGILAKFYIFGKVLFLLPLLRFGYHDVVFFPKYDISALFCTKNHLKSFIRTKVMPGWSLLDTPLLSHSWCYHTPVWAFKESHSQVSAVSWIIH